MPNMSASTDVWRNMWLRHLGEAACFASELNHSHPDISSRVTDIRQLRQLFLEPGLDIGAVRGRVRVEMQTSEPISQTVQKLSDFWRVALVS